MSGSRVSMGSPGRPGCTISLRAAVRSSSGVDGSLQARDQHQQGDDDRAGQGGAHGSPPRKIHLRGVVLPASLYVRSQDPLPEGREHDSGFALLRLRRGRHRHRRTHPRHHSHLRPRRAPRRLQPDRPGSPVCPGREGPRPRRTTGSPAGASPAKSWPSSTTAAPSSSPVNRPARTCGCWPTSPRTARSPTRGVQQRPRLPGQLRLRRQLQRLHGLRHQRTGVSRSRSSRCSVPAPRTTSRSTGTCWC